SDGRILSVQFDNTDRYVAAGNPMETALVIDLESSVAARVKHRDAGVSALPLERVCELGFVLSKAPEHYMSHGNIDHCLTRCGIALVVLAVPPVSAKPSEGPLNDPSLRQHHKSFDVCWSQHGLQQPHEGAFDTLRQVV